jgi:hypothetical protein
MNRCEAPQHTRKCDGIGSTRDHFTPKSLLKVLNFRSPKYWNREENIQYLSPSCHSEKDAITPNEIYWNKFHGGGKTLWQHHNELIAFKKGLPVLEHAA